MTESLPVQLERFIQAHSAELSHREVFTIGTAAGIIARVHAPDRDAGAARDEHLLMVSDG